MDYDEPTRIEIGLNKAKWDFTVSREIEGPGGAILPVQLTKRALIEAIINIQKEN